MAFKYTAGAANAGDRFLVPDGIYEIECIDAKEKTSQKSGNPMLELNWQIVGENGEHGPKLKDWLVMSEAVMWRIDAFLTAIGKHPGEGVEIELEADDLIGTAVRARLKQEKDDKGTNMRVDAYLPPESETEFD
jgi:hypothetical protein